MENLLNRLLHKMNAKKMASCIAIQIYEKQVDKMDILYEIINDPNMHYVIPHIRTLYSGGQIMKVCPVDIKTEILMDMADIISHQFELDSRIITFYDRLMEHPNQNEMIQNNIDYLTAIQKTSQKINITKWHTNYQDGL